MFSKLLQRNVQNPVITPQELATSLATNFPDFKVSNQSRGKHLVLRLKKGLVHLSVFRLKGYLIVKGYMPFWLDILTVGLIEILEPLINGKDRQRVLLYLRDRHDLATREQS